LKIAFHDFKSAQILYEVNHYADSIGSDLQQSLDKSIDSIKLRYINKLSAKEII
jgi:hypothetical protein